MISFPEVLQTMIDLIKARDQVVAENEKLREQIRELNQELTFARAAQGERVPAGGNETRSFEDAVRKYESTRG